MRLLLSASPSLGNLIPVLTLGRAAQRAGHDVALLTGPGVDAVTGSIPMLPAGPSWDELWQENGRRHPDGMGNPRMSGRIGPREGADFFASTRLDMGAEQALRVGGDWSPDIVVGEVSDTFGPLVAAVSGRPWFSHGFGVALPSAFSDAIAAAATPFYRRAGVQPTPSRGYLDPWPAALQPDDWQPPPDRIPIALDPLPSDDRSWYGESLADGYVLVSFGTQVTEREVIERAVASILRHTTSPVVVTRGALADLAFDSDRVVVTGFVGLGALLPGATVAVTAGGSGTVLAALSRAIPVVALPFLPSQRWVAERLHQRGVGVVADSAEDVGPAVARMSASQVAASAARAAAASIADLGSADAALRRVLTLAR